MLKEGIILLLENSTDYLFQLDQAFRSAAITQPLRVARYGNEAILYLKGIGIYGDREHYPLPDLVIIDLVIPDGSALAVYGWLRRHSDLSNIPIVLLNDPLHPKTGNQNFDSTQGTFELSREDVGGLVEVLKHISDESPLPLEKVNPDPDNFELIS